MVILKNITVNIQKVVILKNITVILKKYLQRAFFVGGTEATM